MFKFTEDMKEIISSAGLFIFATANKGGRPNGVPIFFVKMLSADEFLLVDNFMQKTLQNITENPVAAVTCWGQKTRYGYQFKGQVRVETSGDNMDTAVEMVKTSGMGCTPKNAVIVKVDEVYYIGAGKDSGVNLASR